MQLRRSQDNNGETITEEQQAELRQYAGDTLEIVMRLKKSNDFSLYHKNQKILVVNYKREMFRKDISDADLAKAKAAYLAALDMYHVLIEQEITCRRIISKNDPVIGELESERNSHLTSL